MAISRTDTSLFGRWWWTVDRWSLAALLAIASIGLVLTAAASPPVAERIGAEPLHFVKKQAVLMGPALFALVVISLADLRTVRRLAVVTMAGSILALILTLLVGQEIKGAVRWISLAGFSVQPSEFAKPAFAVVSAWLLSARRLGEEIPGYSMAALLYGVVVSLLLMQPDVGQALVLSAIAFTQFFLAGLPMLLVVVMVLVGVFGMVGAYYTFPHVASRIDRFLDPEAGDRYQVDRAMEAFQSGGLFGRGPGEGVVKHYLPDAHADFIFAVAGEEFGLLVCLVLVALFAFVVLRGFARVLNDGNLFAMLAASGLLVQFGLQALINMGSSVHLIPTKGMTLPFVSYGGSSLLAVALGMGMLLALTRTRSGVGS